MTQTGSAPLMQSDLPLPNRRSGKVRDLYDLKLADGTDALLIVASDRISAFDVVMANGVPGKGVVLTQISRFWFDHFADRLTHHLISDDPANIPGLDDEQRRSLRGRIMICRKTNVVPIECVVRGYLAGSGWKDYQKTGAVCGIDLPKGMTNSDRIDEPIFTPATKEATGHDENISFEQACEIVGTELMTKLRDQSIGIYCDAREYAGERGIIIADTKFEWGIPLSGEGEGRGEGESASHGAPHVGADPILIDEVLTPDSSRFWPADRYQPGQEQDPFDKQYVRNYLQELCDAGNWDKTPPGPTLPDDVVANTLTKYRDAYRLLVGRDIEL